MSAERCPTSIVERLRNFCVWNSRRSHYDPVPVCQEAADYIESMESNAREQAKLLADTGQRVEEMADALRFAEKQSDVPNNDDDVLSWAAMLYSRMRDIHTIAGGALSSGEAGK